MKDDINLLNGFCVIIILFFIFCPFYGLDAAAWRVIIFCEGVMRNEDRDRYERLLRARSDQMFELDKTIVRLREENARLKETHKTQLLDEQLKLHQLQMKVTGLENQCNELELRAKKAEAEAKAATLELRRIQIKQGLISPRSPYEAPPYKIPEDDKKPNRHRLVGGRVEDKSSGDQTREKHLELRKPPFDTRMPVKR